MELKIEKKDIMNLFEFVSEQITHFERLRDFGGKDEDDITHFSAENKKILDRLNELWDACREHPEHEEIPIFFVHPWNWVDIEIEGKQIEDDNGEPVKAFKVPDVEDGKRFSALVLKPWKEDQTPDKIVYTQIEDIHVATISEREFYFVIGERDEE